MDFPRAYLARTARMFCQKSIMRVMSNKKTMRKPCDLDPRYLKGIEHFNAKEFFDAHEVWEDLWKAEHGHAHAFIQGLIQFATSLHHFEASNMKGTIILYHGGVELLTPYSPVFWRLNVAQLIQHMKVCVSGLLSYSLSDLPGRYDPQKQKFPVQIKTHEIPIITLEP